MVCYSIVLYTTFHSAIVTHTSLKRFQFGCLSMSLILHLFPILSRCTHPYKPLLTLIFKISFSQCICVGEQKVGEREKHQSPSYRFVSDMYSNRCSQQRDSIGERFWTRSTVKNFEDQ